MAGFKDFADGNVLTAGEVDGYLMRQAVMRFPTTADLTANLPPGIREPGMSAWADDTQTRYVFDTSWKPEESAWTDVNVSFTAGSDQITTGNASVITRWRYSGGMVEVFYKFTVGSTTNLKSGTYTWGLPVAVETGEAGYSTLGSLLFFDSSATAFHTRFVICVGNSSTCVGLDMSNTRVGTTSPTAPSAGDVYAMRLRYRPASSVNL